MISISYIILGLIFFLVGLMHVFVLFKTWDKRIFLTLNHVFSHKRMVPVFRALWPLGTTPVALVLLTLTMLFGIRSYLSIMLVYVSAITVERTIKLIIQRPRPFTLMSDVRMLQPRRPTDPSFPSGDALRVWFLVLALSNSFKLSWNWLLIVFFLAFLITLGRVAMGVHYPSDIISGTGLGVFFVGLYLILIF